MSDEQFKNSEYLFSPFTLEREPMCSPVINYGEVMMFYAPPGIGKTWLALYLAMSASSGSKWLKWQFEHEVKTLYIDGEMGEVELADRLKSMAKSLDVPVKVENFFTIYPERENKFETPNISLYENQKKYCEFIKNEQIKLVIIDNLSSCSSKISDRDNEFQEWARLKKWLVYLKMQGVSVVLVHHTNKGGEQQSGTSERERLINVNMFLSRSKLKMESIGTSFDIEFEKARSFYGDATKKINIELQDDRGQTFVKWFDWEEKIVKELRGLNSLKVPDLMDKYSISRQLAKDLKAKSLSYEPETQQVIDYLDSQSDFNIFFNDKDEPIF